MTINGYHYAMVAGTDISERSRLQNFHRQAQLISFSEIYPHLQLIMFAGHISLVLVSLSLLAGATPVAGELIALLAVMNSRELINGAGANEGSTLDNRRYNVYAANDKQGEGSTLDNRRYNVYAEKRGEEGSTLEQRRYNVYADKEKRGDGSTLDNRRYNVYAGNEKRGDGSTLDNRRYNVYSEKRGDGSTLDNRRYNVYASNEKRREGSDATD